MKQPSLLWPSVICTLALASAGVQLVNVNHPLRFVCLFLFLLACPGLAWIHVLELKEKISEVLLAIALSLAVETAGAMILLYMRQWQPSWFLAVLIFASVAGGLSRLFQHQHTRIVSAPLPMKSVLVVGVLACVLALVQASTAPSQGTPNTLSGTTTPSVEQATLSPKMQFGEYTYHLSLEPH